VRARGSKPPASPTREDLLDAEAAQEGVPGRPPVRHRVARARLAARLARVLAPCLDEPRPADVAPAAWLERALTTSLEDPGLVAALAASLEELDAPLDDGTVLRGDLARLPLAEVLQLCQLRRQSGVLRVTSGERTTVAALRDGAVDLVFAVGAGEPHRLGRHLLRQGLLSRMGLERALAASAGLAPLGEHLVAEGLVAESTLRGVLRQQSSELVYAMLGWDEGTFVLVEEGPWPEAERARLGLGLGELILEGCRRVDELRRLRETLGADACFAIDGEVLATYLDRLGPVERSVVAALDGAVSLDAVVAASLHADLDVLGAVARLLRAKIARRVG